MISETDWHAFAGRFPTLRTDKQSETLIKSNGVVRHVGSGDVLYRDGDECTHLHLVIYGELLLTKHAESGRAITLYRVEDGEGVLRTTHQELAEALGSSREVVSRLLKDWERQGLVELRRGAVTILDSQGLRRIAGNVT